MKHALHDALVTNVKGLIFDSGKNVSYSLEDGYSIMLPINHPLTKKIGLGDSLDLTYASKTKKPTVIKSGATVDFYSLVGVEVLDIKKSEASTKFADLADVDIENLQFMDYSTTGAGTTTSGDSGTVGKM